MNGKGKRERNLAKAWGAKIAPWDAPLQDSKVVRARTRHSLSQNCVYRAEFIAEHAKASDERSEQTRDENRDMVRKNHSNGMHLCNLLGRKNAHTVSTVTKPRDKPLVISSSVCTALERDCCSVKTSFHGEPFAGFAGHKLALVRIISMENPRQDSCATSSGIWSTSEKIVVREDFGKYKAIKTSMG